MPYIDLRVPMILFGAQARAYRIKKDKQMVVTQKKELERTNLSAQRQMEVKLELARKAAAEGNREKLKEYSEQYAYKKQEQVQAANAHKQLAFTVQNLSRVATAQTINEAMQTTTRAVNRIVNVDKVNRLDTINKYEQAMDALSEYNEAHDAICAESSTAANEVTESITNQVMSDVMKEFDMPTDNLNNYANRPLQVPQQNVNVVAADGIG